MQVSVEDLSSVKKVLHIEIPEDEVTRELDEAYNNLRKTAKIKGFRPGKAPRSVLERLYKKNVNAEVSAKLIQESFENAVKETELKFLGNPQVVPTELEEKASYKYDATVEVHPEIRDIDFKGLKLQKKLYQVPDREVDIQIKMLQKNLAQLEPLEEDRPVAEGDFALIDFEGFKDGEPFSETGKTENHTLKIGSGQILKDFDENLVGMIPGERKDITVNFPESYPNDKLADLEITFQVMLKEIRKEVLPEIDDDFAKHFAKKSLDELKDEIRENLKGGYEKRAEQEMYEKVFLTFLEREDFEVPDAMVEYELNNILADAERSFAYRNTSMEQLGLTKEQLSEKYRDAAVKQVKRHLLLNKLIEQEKLILSEEEAEAGMADIAKASDKTPAEIRNHYKQNKEELDFFKHTLLEQKAIALIIENSEIEEIEPE
ncbi:MAG TPA: trigger factor [Desulfobacterales bacterium]|nr:MAG: trigger factor [Deltaproteobacteria bacterium]HHC24266.1 trigger factor [Desulfobacterales bacterium]